MITFNGIDFSTLDWIIITHIDKPLTSGFNNKIATLSGIDKSYDFGFSLQPKVYTIKGIIYAENGNNIYDLFDEFLRIVLTKEEKEFFINANPSKIYKGRLEDAPTLTKININAYEVQFSIICPNPYATDSFTHHIEKTCNTLDTFTVVNRGAVECFPIIKVRNAVSPNYSNYIQNGNFEDFKNGWTFVNQSGAEGTFTMNTSNAHSGDLCACITKPNSYHEHLQAAMTSHTAAHTYYAYAYVYTGKAAGVQMSIIEHKNNMSVVLSELVYSSKVNEWEELQASFTPSHSDSDIYIRFTFVTNDTFTSYIDDVFVADREPAPVDYFGIKINDTQLTFDGDLGEDDVITLDCDKWSAKINDTDNALPYIDGGFPALKVGENTVKVTTNSSTVKVIIDYKERYF